MLRRRCDIAARSRRIGGLVVLLALTLTGACRQAPPAGPPAVALHNGVIELRNLPPRAREAAGHLAPDAWSGVFRVGVTADAPPMLGAYALDGDTVRFTPAFPLDPGRQYTAVFTPAALGEAGAGLAPLTFTVFEPVAAAAPTTTVTRIYPTAAEIPENVLRMYIEFSAPMGRKSGVEYLALLDHNGRDIPGAVLPLDYEFWSPDHRRFTVFFDPGRVKQGVLPNREMGRAFTPGQTVTLVVKPDWRDAQGQPLASGYRRTFTVTPATTRPLDPTRWRLQHPRAGTQEAVVVVFPTPLDHSLLQRALGIRRQGRAVAGTIEIGPEERSWSFVPTAPWPSGTYEFVALDILEDVAGNQVGRAFEVDNFDTVDKDPDPKVVTRSFEIK
jgi:hypothetical protein